MITTSTAPFVLESGSQSQYDGSSIFCEPTFFEITGKFSVLLRVTDSVSTNEIGRGYIELTSAEVDAETGSGTDETEKWFDALQRASITKLGAYPENTSTTFTIV